MTALAEPTVTTKKRDQWAKWLRSAIASAGYKSQQEFADETGFSRVQVQRWVSGDARPREENMPAIVAALKSIASAKEIYRFAGHALDDAEDIAQSPSPKMIVEEIRKSQIMLQGLMEEVRVVRSLLEGAPSALPAPPLPKTPEPGLSGEEMHQSLREGFAKNAALAAKQVEGKPPKKA